MGRHAKGEILVCFKRNCGKDFARELGSWPGYVLSGERYDFGANVFIYKTEEGKEKEACKKFRAYEEFVEWAELRDLKMEARWKALDEVIELIDVLRSKADVSEEEYYKRTGEILLKLKKIK
jgi:hypothetical protein